MADQLEEIKNKINIVDFIGEYLPLKKAGRNFKALCPFHSEKTSSFIVSPERQIWHCFGACNEGGDAFKFLMKMENIEFGEAFKILAKRAGVKLRHYRPSGKEKQKSLLYEINHLAGEFFHYLLLNHPVGKKALDYIFGRGINRASLETFKLGFAPDSWDSLQKFLVGKKGYRAEDIEKAGLVIKRNGQYANLRPEQFDCPELTVEGLKSRERNTSRVSRLASHSNYYDRFRNRLVFPLRDHRGNICGFAGRTLDSGQATAKYINTPDTMIYHKSDLLYGLYENREAVKKVDEVILVEGELDVISSCQAGIKNIVAIKGSALTPSQVRLISRFTKNIALALDQDLAGDQAARRGVEVAETGGLAVKVIEVKGGKDPDEVAQKDPRNWQKQVKNAVGVYDYFLNSAFSRFDSATAEGKRKISQELIPVWAKISNEIVQSHYVGELTRRLGVAEEAVVKEIEKARETREPAYKKQIGELVSEKKPRREILEEYLLALCFQPERWQELRKRKVLRLIKTTRFKGILDVLVSYFKRYKSFSSQRLAKMLPAELKDVFDKLYLIDLFDFSRDEKKLADELEKALKQLEEIDIREKLEKISQEIGHQETQKKLSTEEGERLKKLHQEFRELSLKLATLKK